MIKTLRTIYHFITKGKTADEIDHLSSLNRKYDNLVIETRNNFDKMNKDNREEIMQKNFELLGKKTSLVKEIEKASRDMGIFGILTTKVPGD
jgi:hypothetical protein